MSTSRRLLFAAITAVALPALAGCSGGGEGSADPAAPRGTVEQVDCREVACVALTFDDGPGKFTNALLDELAAHHAQATFFVLGRNVKQYPEVVRRMAAQGHQIGSHGYDHRDITTLTREGIEHEVQWTNEAVQDAAGLTPDVFRPPFGANAVVYNRLIPTPLLLWDVDTMDWSHHDARKTVEIAREEVQPGSVILLHDIHESSVKAVPDLVAALRADGYALITVDQLFAHDDFTAGSVYNSLDTAARAVPAKPSAGSGG